MYILVCAEENNTTGAMTVLQLNLSRQVCTKNRCLKHENIPAARLSKHS